jgi:hypothetical protein
MLKPAYFYTNKEELDKLIYDENCYDYLTLTYYDDFNQVEISSDDWVKIQRVSMSEDGRVLGFFSAGWSNIHENVNNLYLVKFKSKFINDEDKETARQDLEEFIEMLINDPKFRFVKFCSLESNPACRLYDSWIEKYGGYKRVYDKSVKLKDGKYHNVVDYVLYGERWEE